MPLYQFTGPYPAFYPSERDAEGRSLMAMPGMIVSFDSIPPSDGQWIPVPDDASATRPAEPAPAAPEPAPEPPAPEPQPEPEPAPEPAPEPVPAPAEAPEAKPAEPAPAAAPARQTWQGNPVPSVPPFAFPGFAVPGSSYERA